MLAGESNYEKWKFYHQVSLSFQSKMEHPVYVEKILERIENSVIPYGQLTGKFFNPNDYL